MSAWIPALVLVTGEPANFWFPPQASTVAADVDWVYFFIYWVSVFFTALIFGLAAWFVYKYRTTKSAPAAEAGHNTVLELTWTVIPAVIVVFIFYFGTVGYLDLRRSPDDAYEVNVTAVKWSWSFTYPNGYVDNDLHVPEDEPVRLVMTSEDVIHSLFVPAFRVKQDVVPGRYTELWFNANQAGEFQIFCTEYCGTKHSEMLSKVVVHRPGTFEKWLTEASNIHERMSPVEAGQTLIKQRGCLQCHSLDGSQLTGPTFKGLFGRSEQLVSGESITVDENYIRASLLDPQSQVVAGFAPVMPTFQGRLQDRDITAIIAFLKTVK